MAEETKQPLNVVDGKATPLAEGAAKGNKKEKKVKEKGKGKGKGKILIFLVLILAIGGIGVVKMKSNKSGHKVEEKPKLGESLVLEEFLLNLKNEHYLRMTIALGLLEGTNAEGMKEKEPEIRNVVIMLASDLTMDELGSTEGKLKLAEEIKAKVNETLSGGEKDAKPVVLEIFYSGFAMQ